MSEDNFGNAYMRNFSNQESREEEILDVVKNANKMLETHVIEDSKKMSKIVRKNVDIEEQEKSEEVLFDSLSSSVYEGALKGSDENSTKEEMERKLRTAIRRSVDMDEQNKSEEALVTSVVHAKESDGDNIVVSAVEVNIEAAKKRMAEDYAKRVEEIDAKEVALKCMTAIRRLSPKVTSLEQREGSALQALDHLRKENAVLRSSVKDFEQKLDSYMSVNRELITIVGKLADQKEKKGFFGWILAQFKRLVTSKKPS